MLTLRSLDDIQKSIIGSNESISLEFKRSESLGKTSEKISEVIKDISSLANSAGGQIIYGISEKKGRAESIDEGVDFTVFSEEWLLQLTESNASPRIQDISIERIQISETRCIYVISVPQATTYAPHQNLFDKKYYKRYECISVPMADYEIRDALGRSTRPHLKLDATLDDEGNTCDCIEQDQEICVKCSIENISPTPSLYNMFEVFIDRRLEILSHGPFRRKNNRVVADVFVQVVDLQIKIPESMPILQGSTLELGPNHLKISIPENIRCDGNAFFFRYAILAVGQASFASGHLSLENGRVYFPRLQPRQASYR